MTIQVSNHGTVIGFTPLDEEGRSFLADVGAEAWQFLGSTLVLDHRVAHDFITLAKEEGIEFV